MERALTYITLDVQKIDSGQLIKAKRGDSARRLVVSLTSRGRPYIPGEGVTAVFYERKPDGNPCFNDCDIDGCTVAYDFTGQTTNVVGLAACEIRLYDAENHLLTSPGFELLVDATEYQEGDVPDSSPEYTALTEMVAKGTELIRDLTDVQAGLEPIRDAAVEAARSAAGSADDARTQAETAGNYAQRAEQAAKRAEEVMTFSAADAGSLLLVAADGRLVPIAIGTGLRIENGVLTVVGLVPEAPDGVEVTVSIVDGMEVLTDSSGQIVATIVDGIEYITDPTGGVTVTVVDGIQIIT